MLSQNANYLLLIAKIAKCLRAQITHLLENVLSPGSKGETDPVFGPASGRSNLRGRMMDNVYCVFMGNRS